MRERDPDKKAIDKTQTKVIYTDYSDQFMMKEQRAKPK